MKTKEHNIVLLATDKSSELFITDNEINKLTLNYRKGEGWHNNTPIFIPQHLYILSSEEIKEGDWIYCATTKRVLHISYIPNLEHGTKLNSIWKNYKKIITTTDSDIWGWLETDKKIPSIPESFIKTYVEEYNKGNVIDKVLVEYESKAIDLSSWYWQLKLNPDNTINISVAEEKSLANIGKGMSDLTQPQPKMYSREEVEELLYEFAESEIGKHYLEITNIEGWIKENLK